MVRAIVATPRFDTLTVRRFDPEPLRGSETGFAFPWLVSEFLFSRSTITARLRKAKALAIGDETKRRVQLDSYRGWIVWGFHTHPGRKCLGFLFLSGLVAKVSPDIHRGP